MYTTTYKRRKKLPHLDNPFFVFFKDTPEICCYWEAEGDCAFFLPWKLGYYMAHIKMNGQPCNE